ncbi:MAG: lysoplasmalogenase [Myxococcales bacterium]|nr:lysoplasmalogenase [Myxococcales bacterium]
MSAVPLCLLATAILVWAERARIMGVRAVTKTVASLAFVLAAVQAGSLDAGVAGLALLVALGLSVVGDLLLLSRARPAFLGGLGAFLLAHVAFVATFLTLAPDPRIAAVAAVPVAAVCAGVWRWLSPRAGSMGGPVLAYVVVIGAMTATSFGLAARSPWVPVAAVVFLLSDLCVARDRFVSPGWENRLVGLPLYYGAQLLFAWAIPMVALDVTSGP